MSRRAVTMGNALSAVIDHRGKTPKKLGGDWTLSGHRVISALNIKGSRVDMNDHHYVSAEMYAKWMKVPLQAGDVLLTSEAPMGEVAYLARDVDWCVGQRLFALRADPTLLIGRYLYYLLLGGSVRDQLFARSTGSTVVGIRQSELVKISLQLPSLDEQEEVVATLGTLDDKIDSASRARDLAWELLETEYRALAEVGVDAQLGDVLRLHYGKALPAKVRQLGHVPVYGSSGVTGWHTSALIEGPAIVVGRKGTIGEVHWSHVPCFPIDTTFYVQTEAFPLLAAYFALRAADLPHMNSDSAVPGLNRDAAHGRTIRMPNRDAALEWANSRSEHLDLIAHLERQIALLISTRDALIPVLLAPQLQEVG